MLSSRKRVAEVVVPNRVSPILESTRKSAIGLTVGDNLTTDLAKRKPKSRWHKSHCAAKRFNRFPSEVRPSANSLQSHADRPFPQVAVLIRSRSRPLRKSKSGERGRTQRSSGSFRSGCHVIAGAAINVRFRQMNYPHPHILDVTLLIEFDLAPENNRFRRLLRGNRPGFFCNQRRCDFSISLRIDHRATSSRC